MSCFRKAIVYTLLISLLRAVYGQTIVIDNSTVPANESTVAPAVAIVDVKESNSTADLFNGEAQQLTDAVIANLTDLKLSDIALFGFQNESTLNETLAKRAVPGFCKTYPDDPYWPFSSTWQLFNVLLGGGLIKTVPSINAVLFQGSTCMPPALMPAQSSCTVGGYPEYAVSIRNVAQIQLAINFARNLNLRVVIKNTGHDFSAKSVGMGALSIWTHNLKQIRFFRNYRQGSYRGPAFKLGTGVQAFEVYEAARENNVTVVGGEGRTVGVMGGFLLGGGHSPLSSLYGMAADQVLSMEVVTADGRFVTASETSHPSLFWALRGGGGSTFGVVTSVVVKAYPKIKVTTFFDGFITYTDAGNYEYFRISKLGEGRYFSDMGPWFAPGMNKTQLERLVAPMFAKFKELGVEVNPIYTEYDDFYDAWYASFPVEPWGSNAIRQASRLFPTSNWEDTAKLNATFDVIKSVVEEGGYIVAFNIAAAPKTGYPDNAVNPAWRNTVMHAIMATLWNTTSSEAEMKAASDRLTYGWMQRWRDVSPGAGAYMSEADYIEPDFAQAFFGTNYARLYRIKQFYDPFGVFAKQ